MYLNFKIYQMKLLVILIFFPLIFLCQIMENKEEKVEPICDFQNLKLKFEHAINIFNPREVSLSKSMNKNTFKFIRQIDSVCLMENDDFDNFTIIILIKQYNFHLKEYHQGFDLLMMREGSAKLIIDNFCKIANIDNDIEMLNSGYILEYIEQKGLYEKYKTFIENK